MRDKAAETSVYRQISWQRIACWQKEERLEANGKREQEETATLSSSNDGREFSRCEQLMAQGVMQLSELAKHSGVSIQKVTALRRKVLNAWENLALSGGSASAIGRFVRKIELVERTAWTLLSDDEEERQEKVAVLKLILSAIEEEVRILGLGHGEARDEKESSLKQEFVDYQRKVESIVETLERSGELPRTQ